MQKLRSVSGRAHQQPMATGNLYREVRLLVGYTVTHAARSIGITQRAWSRREIKERYRADELIGLYRMSGLSPAKFLELLEKCR